MNTISARQWVLVGAASILFAIPAITTAAEDHELEPCINGGVSATGLYPSQAIEDAALSNIKLVENRDIPGSDFEAQKQDN